MNRRRLPSRRDWPANLYCDSTGYYSYRNPITGKKKGIGRDKAKAFSEARAANKAIASISTSTLAHWVLGVERLSLKDWIPTYKKLWTDLKKPAKSTFYAAGKYLERVEAEDFAAMPLDAITTVHIAKYLDGIAENSGVGAAKAIRTRLSDVFEYAITKGHIKPGQNPVTSTILPTYRPTRDRLTLETYLAILAKSSGWLTNAMLLALLTGQRLADVSEMRFSDIRDGCLQVAQGKSQGQTRLMLDLNIRLHVIQRSIADGIKACRDRIVSPYLIHHTITRGRARAGDQVSPAWISKAFAQARDDAGIKPAKGKTPVTFHEIRSLAERLYRQEYGKEFAQSIMGHKSEAMTAKYDDPRGGWQLVRAK